MIKKTVFKKVYSHKLNDEIKSIIKKETWGNNIPMVYMDQNKNLVKHYRNGNIVIIKQIN